MLHFINFHSKFVNISVVHGESVVVLEKLTKRKGTAIIRIRLFLAIYLSCCLMFDYEIYQLKRSIQIFG